MGVSVPYSLVVYVLLGGALAGLFQSRVLASRSIEHRGWILASVIAWALAGAAVMLNDAMVGNVPGFLGLFAFIGVVLFGGVLNGAVTGAALHRALAAEGEDV
jgi:hypothetical protein